MADKHLLASIFSDDSQFPAGSERATMWGFILHARNVSQIVRCAALFSLADHLAGGSRTAGEIAAAESLDPDAVFRLMRACAAHGLMRLESDGRFAGTPLLATLRSDDKSGLKEMAIAQGAPGHWAPVGRMPDAIRTGKPQAKAAFGKDIWTYLLSDGAEELAAWMRGMGRMNAGFVADVVKALDTTHVGFAVDVGGANGSVLLALLASNSELKGAVFDLPAAEQEATRAVQEAGLENRLAFVAGDFLTKAPEGDLYILKHVLHNWLDPQALRILQVCREAARPDARLVVMEMLVEEEAPTPFTTTVDLLMLSLNGARERTLKEYEALLKQAGFRVDRMSSTSTPTSLIHAVAF